MKKTWKRWMLFLFGLFLYLAGGQCAVRAADMDSPEKMDLRDAQIEDIRDMTYSGEACKPALVVSFNGKKLTAGTDYAVTYSNNINAGKACATVTGKGNYCGSQSKYFTVKPLEVQSSRVVRFEPTGYVDSFSVSSYIRGGLTITYRGRKLTANDYQISEASIYGNQVYSFTLMYRNNYSGSEILYNLGLYEISAIGDVDYTGKPAEPPVKVGNLTAGRDYVVKYANNTAVGTAKVKVLGIGKYTGTLKASFRILGTKPVKPKAPVVQIKSSYDGLTLGWAKVENASGYVIYRRSPDGKCVKVRNIKSGDTLRYTDVPPEPNVKYAYVVVAYNTASGKTVKSGRSNVVKGMMSLAKPVIKGKAIEGRHKIVWQQIPGADGYVLYRKTGNGEWKQKKLSPGALKYICRTTQGQTYAYRLRAYRNVNGKTYYSPYSSILRAPGR